MLGASLARVVSCGGLGTAPKTAAGARMASAPASHAQARSSRLEARGRRPPSVIEDPGLLALAARTGIAFELGFRFTARQVCNAAGARGYDDRVTGGLGLPVDGDRAVDRPHPRGSSIAARAEDTPSSPSESAADAAINTATRPPAMIRAKRFFNAPTSLSGTTIGAGG
jgi:hypothetical protein